MSKQAESTTLENTIIEIATQKLDEYKYHIEKPDEDEEISKHYVTSAFLSISQLVEIANVINSGLSKGGIKKLQDIEAESMSLIHNWPYKNDQSPLSEYAQTK